MNWIAGAFYKQETLFFPPNDGFVLTNETRYVPGVQVPEITLMLAYATRNFDGVFGQAAYNITDSLKLQAGLRYQHYSNGENSVLAIPILNFTFPPIRRSTKKTPSQERSLSIGRWTNLILRVCCGREHDGRRKHHIGTPNFNNQTASGHRGRMEGAVLLENRLFTRLAASTTFSTVTRHSSQMLSV